MSSLGALFFAPETFTACIKTACIKTACIKTACIKNEMVRGGRVVKATGATTE